ncbi:dihydropteroate synthase [Micromonospora sp. BRA006-A]|nr:dihydropteroate synthase [Micromonospora sp. BRA006-A]
MTDLVRAETPVVMGVLNVTPDSFSDGGRYADLDAAVAHGVRLRSDGADLIDGGGESTRPGAERVDAETETVRVLPVVREPSAAGILVSIDTSRARVAEAVLAAGAYVVNDVSGGSRRPGHGPGGPRRRLPLGAHAPAGAPAGMRELATYTDVVAEVRDELSRRVDAALAAGVAADRIIVDPGLGFAKTAAHNWALSARPPELVDLGFPVLFGASRKSYLGRLLADPAGEPRPTAGREAATVATSVLAVAAGAWGTRARRPRHRRRARRLARHRQPRLAGATGVRPATVPRTAAATGGTRPAEASTGTSGGDG